MNLSRLRMCLLTPCCLLFSGCVTKSISAEGAIFHYQLWIPIAIFAAGLVFVPIGFIVRKEAARFGWGLMIAGPMLAGLLAPSMLVHRVVVHDRGFEIRSGMWVNPERKEIDFDSIKGIRTAREETGGRNSRQIEVLYFELKEGNTISVPLNNDVNIEAANEIISRAKRLRINVVGR